jgi:hypothetical protein
MKNIDPVVKKETIYIALFSFILSVLLQAIFLIIGKWNYTILLGNILGYIAAVGNFLIMGLSVQKAVQMDEKDAKAKMKVSQSFRMLFLFVIAVIGYAVPVFNTISVVIPFLFPRVAIALRPLFNKK